MRPPPRIYLRRRRRIDRRRDKAHNLIGDKTAWHTLAQMIVACLWPRRGALTAALLSLCLGWGVTLLSLDKLWLLVDMLREANRDIFSYYCLLPLIAAMYTYYRIKDKYSCQPNHIDRQLDGGEEHPRFRGMRIKTVSATRKAERARVSRVDNVDRIILRLKMLGTVDSCVDRRKVVTNITRLAEDHFGSYPRPEGYIRRHKALHSMADEIVRLAKAETDLMVLDWLLRLMRRVYCTSSIFAYTRAFSLLDGVRILKLPHGYRVRTEAVYVMLAIGRIPRDLPIPRELCEIVERFEGDYEGGGMQSPEAEVGLAISLIAKLLKAYSDAADIQYMIHNGRFMNTLLRVARGSHPRARSFLAELLVACTVSDRSYVIDNYTADLNTAIAKCNTSSLLKFAELDATAAVMVQSNIVLDSVWRRMTTGGTNEDLHWSIVRLLDYCVSNNPSALQQLLGMGMLDSARYFAKDNWAGPQYALIFGRVLNVHPEFKQSFRRITANGTEESHTARLGRSIPIRNPTPGTTYVMMGAL